VTADIAKPLAGKMPSAFGLSSGHTAFAQSLRDSTQYFPIAKVFATPPQARISGLQPASAAYHFEVYIKSIASLCHNIVIAVNISLCKAL